MVLWSGTRRPVSHITSTLRPSLALKPPARLNPIEVAVDVELQQDHRMIRRPTSYLESNPVKSQLRQIKLINKDIDHPNRITLVDPVFQALWEQRASCPRSVPSTKRLIQPSRESYRARITSKEAFSHRVGHSRHFEREVGMNRFAPMNGHRQQRSGSSGSCQQETLQDSNLHSDAEP